MNTWAYWDKKGSVGTVFKGEVDAITILDLKGVNTPWIHIKTSHIHHTVAQMMRKHNLKGISLDCAEYYSGSQKKLLETGSITSIAFRESIENEAIEALQHATSLTELVAIDATAQDYLLEVSRNTSVTSLSISKDMLTPNNLVDNKTIRALRLHEVALSPGDTLYLSNMSGITRLDLSHNEILLKGLKNVASLPFLTDLNVSMCGIANGSLYPLERNTTIKRLDISKNSIDNQGKSHFV